MGFFAGGKLIKGVEVDVAGCSFNPDSEQHQDAIAEAVAIEMAKVYAHEHIPAPNKVFNHMPDPDELEALLVNLSIIPFAHQGWYPTQLQELQSYLA